MSGAAGGVIINKEDLKATIRDYRETVLKPLNLDKSYNITGVRRRPEKNTFGDIDIVLSFPGGDKKQLKKDFAQHLEQIDKIPNIPRKKNKKYFIHGSIVTNLYPIVGKPDQYVQIDNIITPSEDEGKFTYSMLDLPAQEQGLTLGLAKAIFTELNPNQIEQLFKDLNIPQDIEKPKEGEEYDFNLNTSGLSLKIAPIGKSFGKEIWKSSKFNDTKTLLKSLGVDIENDKFRDIVKVVKNFKSRRSIDRLKGMFAKNIRVSDTEVGRDKGIKKQQALDKVASLEEKFSPLVMSLISPLILENEEKPKIAIFPGKFKPPHKDHLARIMAASKFVGPLGTVKVIISPKSTKEDPNQETITAEQSLSVFNLYKSKGIIPDNVKIEISQYPSPVVSAWKEFETNKDKPQEEQQPYIAVFGKNETKRYAGVLKIPNITINDFPEAEVGNESATNVRTALKNGDDITRFLPNGIDPKEYKQALGLNAPINEADPKKGTGKKPKGSKRRLYTDEDPSDTVKVKFSTRQDIIDTLNKTSFKSKSHARQSQVINLIHQRVRAALSRTKDPQKKAKLRSAFEYIKKRKEASKKKTQRLKKEKTNEAIDTNFDKVKFYYDYYTNVSPTTFGVTMEENDIKISNITEPYPPNFGPKNVRQIPVNQNLKENLNEDILEKTSLVLPRGKKIYLQAEEENYDRGIIVELSKEGGYKINYWYGDDAKIYPVEVEVDGESIKPDAIEVYMKFHPELKKENVAPNHDGKSSPYGSGYKPLKENKTTHKVIAKGVVFEPKNITINVGDTVEWENKEGYHNVNGKTSHPRNKNNPESFGNKVGSGWTYKFTFTKPGLYKYHCDPHLSADMVGTVKVKGINETGQKIAKKNMDDYKRSNTLNENTTYSNYIDYKQQIENLTKHMLKKGMNIKPLPKVIFKHNNEENAKDFLGKTAYYDPNNKVVVLYTEGRHPKDVVRSYAHEMIHHIQNLEGRLKNISTTNTMEDDYLNDIEREAYTKGNMLFRNYTDGIDGEEVTSLNEKEKPYKHKHGFDDKLGKDPFGLNQYARELASLEEGRYDTLSNQISRDIFNFWKEDFNEGEVDSTYEDDYNFPPRGIQVYAQIIYKPGFGKLKIDGGSDYAYTDKETEKKYPGFVKVTFIVDPKMLPEFWEEISMNLKDVVRHEIEHITQSGDSKTKKEDFDEDFDITIRALVKADIIPQAEYFKLPKEVDANLQGMYFRAKKEKRPFIDVINTYLDAQDITPKDKQIILNLWRSRRKALSLPKF